MRFMCVYEEEEGEFLAVCCEDSGMVRTGKATLPSVPLIYDVRSLHTRDLLCVCVDECGSFAVNVFKLDGNLVLACVTHF
jgi:hypothetical protein